MASTHEMKSQPQFFEEILADRKTHDLRRDDRMFETGDTVRLREWSEAAGYTGREAMVEITYITDVTSPCVYSSDALHPNFCILSIRRAPMQKVNRSGHVDETYWREGTVRADGRS